MVKTIKELYKENVVKYSQGDELSVNHGTKVELMSGSGYPMGEFRTVESDDILII